MKVVEETMADGGERTTRARSLLPKEHGAWAQFFFPLVTGLLLAGFDASAWLLATGAAALFFVHEPALVLLGRRGARAKEEAGERARRLVAAHALVGSVTGPLGLWMAPDQARFAAFGALGLGVGVAVLVVRDEEKTTVGELLAALSLASVGLVVALAGGAEPVSAWTLAGVWAGVFVPATFAVRAVIAQSKSRPALGLKLAAVASGLGGIVSAWFSGTALSPEAALFLLPGALPSVVLALVPPHAKRLRQVGWMLAGACVVVSVFAVRIMMRG